MQVLRLPWNVPYGDFYLKNLSVGKQEHADSGNEHNCPAFVSTHMHIIHTSAVDEFLRVSTASACAVLAKVMTSRHFLHCACLR